jgi:hypothetical protein
VSWFCPENLEVVGPQRDKSFSFPAAYQSPHLTQKSEQSSEQIGLRWVISLAVRWGMVESLIMPEYRFYNLEHDGQAVIARIDLMLDDDATAIAHAKQLIVGEAIEVWEGSRLVANLSTLQDTRSVAPANGRKVA